MANVLKPLLWVTAGVTMIVALGGLYIHSEREKQREVATATVILDLEEAIGKYHSEFGRLPDTGAADFTMDSPAGQRLLAALMGDGNPGDSARSIRFLPLPRPMKSLDPTEKIIARATTDAWGFPFRVILDDDFDQRIAINPGEGETEISVVHALVLSRGRDRIEGTPDDIQSWRFKP
jgi:hypothetical protein